MDLHHEFTVPVPASDAWRILTDLERLAPCLPGAQLTEVEGEIYRGQVKVKVGPILAQFKGQASFVSRDDANFLASLKAEGRDTTGKGNASATITARLDPVTDTSAKCTVDTQLNISGKVAQFGRGALADVSDKLLLQFVDNLNSLIASQPVTASNSTTPSASDSSAMDTAVETAPPTPGVRKIEQTHDVAPLDLLDTAGSTIVKRLVPVALVLAAVVAALVIFR
ncbi:MAG: SRPBCC family protein [Ilumatobacteraceae bacterium]|jgi:carbon monoxide dehydrogenase subunit G